MSGKRVVIIGGGIGGLFTGALLSREGYRVTVLEKNATAGGGLQTFTRGGLTFETGMHILGGLRRGGSVYKICNYLGIMDKIDIVDADHDCMDQIDYLDEGLTYRLPEGREAFGRYLAERFPGERQGISDYLDAIYRIADEVDFFYLRPNSGGFKTYSEEFTMAADRLIEKYIGDERLRDLLAYMNPMYGGVRSVTPAYVNALINVLYIDGASRFAGGSSQLAAALCDVIAASGGEVLTGQEVTRLAIDRERKASGVFTASGGHFSGDIYVSSIHPSRLVDLADEGAFMRAYTRRMHSLPNTYSAFIVFVALKPDSFPYINHTCYCQDRFGSVWHLSEDDDRWPRGFMYMTPAERAQGPYATKMIINCLLPYSAVAQWRDTTLGHRGDDYERWKERRAASVLNSMERLYSGFGDCVERVWTASPLTIRDYYNQPEGSLYGISKDCNNLMASQIPVWTKVPNLYLTGQNINLHGICGVPLTAMLTSQAIIGDNSLTEKINHYHESYG